MLRDEKQILIALNEKLEAELEQTLGRGGSRRARKGLRRAQGRSPAGPPDGGGAHDHVFVISWVISGRHRAGMYMCRPLQIRVMINIPCPTRPARSSGAAERP